MQDLSPCICISKEIEEMRKEVWENFSGKDILGGEVGLNNPGPVPGLS